MKTRILSIGLLLFSMSLVSYGQSRQDKIEVIINKLNLIETQKESLIAIVLGKYIVSMPLVYADIMNGKAVISGDFSEDEIDGMIKVLKEKQ